jgi:hypothetical protein
MPSAWIERHPKKAVADARLYGGIETAQVTAAKCLVDPARVALEKTRQRRGKATHRPATRAKFTRQARRPAKFAARAKYPLRRPTFKLPRVRERRTK